MLRFQSLEKIRQTVVVTAPIDSLQASTRADTPPEEKRIALFLDEIIHGLAALPADLYHGVRAEMRAHLESLVAAHEELGATREEAVPAAIRQFGDSKRIARRFRQAWRQTAAYERPWAAMRLALGTFCALIALACLCDVALSGYNIWQTGDHRPSSSECNLFLGFVFALPVLGGIYIGCRSPRRAALGTFLAYLVLLIVAWSLDSMFYSWNYGYGGTPFTLEGLFRTLVSDIPIMILYMFPLGCLSAAMTSTLQRRRLRRRSGVRVQ